VLTINTLSRKLPRESGRFERMACIARLVPDTLPEVHRLMIPDETIQRVFAQQIKVEQQTTVSDSI